MAVAESAGPRPRSGGASVDHTWTVDRYCLHTLVDAPTAAALQCRPS